VVIGIEVIIGVEVTFSKGLRKNDVNKVDIANNAAKDKVMTADNSDTPLSINFNLFI
jgi:hypothetical protein